MDALVLSASVDRLRLVIPGSAETAELQWIENRWMSESGAAVEVGGMIAVEGVNPQYLCHSSQLKVRAAT